MKRLEIILIIAAVIGFLLELLDLPFSSLIVSLFLVALGLLYFYLGFALFNGIHLGKIFDPESYKGIGTWSILIAVATGMALSVITIGVMFTVLSYPMARTILITGLVCTAVIFILAVGKNAKEKNQFYRNLILRCLVFLILAVIFLLLPSQIFEKS